jgi:hypothetical protein
MLSRSHRRNIYLFLHLSHDQPHDPYTGLHRFGRVIDQRWTDGSSDIDRYQYAYDAAGNVLQEEQRGWEGFQ